MLDPSKICQSSASLLGGNFAKPTQAQEPASSQVPVADQKAFEAATLNSDPKTFELGVPEDITRLRRLGGIDRTLGDFKNMIVHDFTNPKHKVRNNILDVVWCPHGVQLK